MPEAAVRIFLEKLREHRLFGDLMKRGQIGHYANTVNIDLKVRGRSKTGRMVKPDTKKTDVNFVRNTATAIAKERGLLVKLESNERRTIEIRFLRKTMV